jgi:hypothetical protein
VAVELKRSGHEVYFWKGKKEVDFVVREGGRLTAINVTYTDSPHQREAEGLTEFRDKYPGARLVIITKGIEKTDKNKIECIPLWKWLTHWPGIFAIKAKP